MNCLLARSDLDPATHKHKECMNFNRRICSKCLKAIKVPIDDVQMSCNYRATCDRGLIEEIPLE